MGKEKKNTGGGKRKIHDPHNVQKPSPDEPIKGGSANYGLHRQQTNKQENDLKNLICIPSVVVILHTI
jgi:hypothetical protein